MRTVALGDVVSVNPRGSSIAAEDPVSFVGMADLDAESATASPRETRIFRAVSKGYTVFRDRDILAAKITPCWENGKVGQAKLAHRVGVGSTEFHVLRPGPKIYDRYLLHFLRRPSIRAAGELRMTGSAGQRRVPTAFLEGLEIPVVPVEEQRRVAAILDHVDALRGKRRQIIDGLGALEQSIFQEFFGAPQRWVDWWKMGSIGDMVETAQYGTSAKAGSTGEWPVLRMGNISDDGRLDLADLKYMDLDPKDVPKYTVRRGDLLFNRTNSKEKVGKSSVVDTDRPLAYAGYLVRVRFKPEYRPEFVSAYLASPHGRAVRQRTAKAAVNQANINASEMQRISIALPPKDIQDNFVRCLHSARAVARTVESALLDELFASLQYRAFRGEL